MTDRIRVAIIYGSTREGRFCDTMVRWVLRQVEDDGRFDIDVIDPGALALRLAPDGEVPAGLRQKLAQAEAFVVVTPEYNHSYPAALKSLIDAVHREWQTKPVGFVSYGGVSGGLRAVEHLRLVFAELHAVTLRDTVSFANAWQRFSADGELADGSTSERAMAHMLAHLDWWARALKKARRILPYERVAA